MAGKGKGEGELGSNGGFTDPAFTGKDLVSSEGGAGTRLRWEVTRRMLLTFERDMDDNDHVRCMICECGYGMCLKDSLTSELRVGRKAPTSRIKQSLIRPKYCDPRDTSLL